MFEVLESRAVEFESVKEELRRELLTERIPQGDLAAYRNVLLRGSRIALRISQSDLGELLGASRQRVNNVLKQFERDGAVRLAAGGVRILGHALLRDRALGRPPCAGGGRDGVQSDKVFR